MVPQSLNMPRRTLGHGTKDMVVLDQVASGYAQPRLNAEQFAAIREITYRVCGINLHEGKEGLVQSRLTKRLRALGLRDFGSYLDYVCADETGSALSDLVDALTTNKTSFFRESRHFDLLSEQILPELLREKTRIRIWSAGCSSGEEPYTLAMLLHEATAQRPGVDARVLATDVSRKVLTIARAGVYDEEALADVPETYARRYFRRVGRSVPKRFRVTDEVRRRVQFARLNLMDQWPMRGPMDVIFCRNVMIYFDKETQERLIARLHALLAPGGYLFVGHSESLSGVRHGFEYVQPAVYVR